MTPLSSEKILTCLTYHMQDTIVYWIEPPNWHRWVWLINDKDTTGSGIKGVFSKIMCQMSRELAVIQKKIWVWSSGVREIYAIKYWSSNSFWDCLCNYQEFGGVPYSTDDLEFCSRPHPTGSLGDLTAPHLYLLGLSALFWPTRSAIQFLGYCHHCNFTFLRNCKISSRDPKHVENDHWKTCISGELIISFYL